MESSLYEPGLLTVLLALITPLLVTLTVVILVRRYLPAERPPLTSLYVTETINNLT